MTLDQLYRNIIASLSPSLGADEAKATARLLLEDDLQATTRTLALHGDRELEPETVTSFDGYIRRIIAGEPPQYVIGRARFMGMDFKVTLATLIPRPETAQLVDMITDRFGSRTDLHVLDIGTGSGCIAIALSRALPFARVDAIDISADALTVAAENARTLMAKVNFAREDILTDIAAPATPYDIIVSNPPYVLESEKATMESRVKDFEPASALFVPDSDPLKFYKAIAAYALKALCPTGALFFEINPLEADNLSQLLNSEGFICDVLPDMFGKARFATATLKK